MNEKHEWQSSLYLAEMLSNSIDNLSRIGKAFQDFVSSDVNKGIPLGIRRMNDIKMGVDKILTSPPVLRYTSLECLMQPYLLKSIEGFVLLC